MVSKELEMRVIVYDPTDAQLSLFWKIGAWLYCFLGFADKYFTDPDFETLLTKLPDAEKIAELQFWCHGKPGLLGWAGRGIPIHFFKKPLVKEGGLMWFRACSVFSGISGRTYVGSIAAQMNCKVAAHTHKIGQGGLQSGLHVHDPKNPLWDWLLEEGILEGTPENPVEIKQSWFTHPNTVSIFTYTVPRKFWQRC